MDIKISFTAYVDEENVYNADPFIGTQISIANRFYSSEVFGENISPDYYWFIEP